MKKLTTLINEVSDDYTLKQAINYAADEIVEIEKYIRQKYGDGVKVYSAQTKSPNMGTRVFIDIDKK